MRDRFRHAPPLPQTTWVRRPRLLARLDRRFDVAVTIVEAPAGYGKTSLLAQALAEAGDDSSRVDLWLQCEPSDSDAETLGAAILRSCGFDAEGTTVVSAARIAGVLSHLAPAHVCLVLDDLHTLAAGSSGLQLLDELLDVLPHNAHLVLSGRAAPPLRLARRQVAGIVDHLGPADLSFDDSEVAAVVGGDAAVDPDDDIVRWSAMAVLVHDIGGSGPVDFLLQEVAAGLDDGRRAALAALSHLSDVDDDAVLAATSNSEKAESLFADLPLVHRSPGGTYQMHDLWRQALAWHNRAALDPAVAEALVRVADLRIETDPVEAAELYAAAGHPGGMEQVAHQLVSAPLVFTSAADLRRVAELANATLGPHPLNDLLAATVIQAGGEEASAEAFEATARAAAQTGDAFVESLALQGAANMRLILGPIDIPAWIGERADALVAEGHSEARAAASVVRAHAELGAGSPERALAALNEMAPPRTPIETIFHAFGMGDLGRPELVSTPSSTDDALAVAVAGGGQYVAQAMWLRGEIGPELALELGSELAANTDEGRIAHIQVSTNAVLSIVALAAGDGDAARRFANEAMQRSAACASPSVQQFAMLADAMCVLHEQGEDPARAQLAEILHAMPIQYWPPRPYFYALPAVYVLAPETRGVLDGCRFGPALTTARDAGQALVALRERGDPAPATALPWDRPWLLRAHVLPVHLASLAAAAAAAGSGDVGAAVAEIPDLRTHLALAAQVPEPRTAAWALDRIAALPARPPHDIGVDLLGVVQLRRGDAPVLDAPWSKRERVRQLLALVALHTRIGRVRAAELLWPELDQQKALANLRVNLSHLQSVLQPTRDPAEPPWFLRTDADTLTIAPSGVVVDVVQFDRACSQARALDDRGRTSEAIDALRVAVSLYRGELLQQWSDAEWADSERIRLRSLSIKARCRLGELLLTRGEPEEAAVQASSSLRDEPLHEPSGCLLVHALIAQGDRAGARRAMSSLLAMLADHGLRPERSTEMLAGHLGIEPSP